MEGSDSDGPPRAARADIVSGDVSTPAKAQFRFGTRFIQAAGSTADNRHPNVLLLKIEPSVFQNAAQFLLRVLLWTGLRLENKFPEWFLPDRIVLKTQKPDWEEEFDNELLAIATGSHGFCLDRV